MCFEPRFKSFQLRTTHSSHNLGGCSRQWVLRQRTNSRQTSWKTAVLEVDTSQFQIQNATVDETTARRIHCNKNQIKQTSLARKKLRYITCSKSSTFCSDSR